MEKFIEEISSVYWWIGVVIVGILINITSSYIRKFMEKKLSNIYSYWENKKEERVKENLRKIKILKTNNELRIIYALRESRYRIRSLMFFIFGGAMMTSGVFFGGGIVSIVMLGISAITFMIGLLEHLDAMKVKQLVEDSVDGLDELDT